MTYIGIDTGVNTGFAVWNNRRKAFEEIATVKIHEAMAMVKDWVEACEAKCERIVVRVEDPRQRTWYETNRMTRDEERKRLQGVGSVKRDASVWDDYLADLSKTHKYMTYEMVAPKNNRTKLSKEQFVSYTSYSGRTNEHSRDAAMLVFGY